MADYKPSLEKKFGDITEPELVAKSPEYGKQHDVSWELQIIEWRSSAFIELV